MIRIENESKNTNCVCNIKSFKNLVDDTNPPTLITTQQIGENWDGNANGSIGILKASADGSRVAETSNSNDKAQILDFDNTTGTLSNPITLSNIGWSYGVEFSPNADVLYVNSWYHFTPSKLIYQYDNTAGTWGNQFDGIQFNPLIPNGEYVDRPAFIHFDAGAGIVYNFKRKERYMSGNDEFSFTAGISAFHLNRPNYSFIQTANERLSIRYAAFAMARIGKMNSNYAFTPALYYNRQGGHQEILAGTYLRVKVSESSHYTGYIDEMAVSFGAFYRVQDALVAKFLFEFAGYSFGFSYDINLSKLTRASNGRGGMEFFLRYTLGNIFQPNSQMRFK